MGKYFISALRLLETFPLLDMIGRDMDLRDCGPVDWTGQRRLSTRGRVLLRPDVLAFRLADAAIIGLSLASGQLSAFDGRDPVALLWPGPRCSYVALGLL